jgi:hypothetical protein
LYRNFELYGLHDKLASMTSDNTSSMDVAAKDFSELCLAEMQEEDKEINSFFVFSVGLQDGKDACACHVVSLSAQDALKVCTESSYLLDKVLVI